MGDEGHVTQNISIQGCYFAIIEALYYLDVLRFQNHNR